jgi:hypothetical protein
MIEDECLGLSSLDPLSPLLVPAIFGGDGQVKEVAAAPAGTSASATALTQFIPPLPQPSCRWSGTQVGALRQHTGFIDARLVTRRRRRLGPQLAAARIATLDDLGNTINKLLDTTMLP